jgi:hypothetical protein
MTLHSSHPRKNNNNKNKIANNIHGCQRIANFHLALNQTALKWAQLLLEVLYPNDVFPACHSDPRSKQKMLDRARAELKHEMNQPDHPLHEQYVCFLALFNKVEAAASGSLSRPYASPSSLTLVFSHSISPSLPPAPAPPRPPLLLLSPPVSPIAASQ